MAGISDEALGALAAKVGLLTAWQHADGSARQVAPDTLRAALRALRLPCENEQDRRASLHCLDAQQPSAMRMVASSVWRNGPRRPSP